MTASQSLRVIWRLMRIDISMALVYRIEFVMYMISTVVGPAIALMIWRAAMENGAALPIDAQYLTTYFVLLGVVSMLTSSWISGFLAEHIRLGRLSIWMVRPGSTHLNGIANNLSEKVIKIVPLAPMVGILWWYFRDSFVLPADPVTWLHFAVSVIAAAIMVYALDVLVGSLAFWLDDITGIDRARGLLSVIFRGQLVPLALMPAWSQGLIDVQPFRFTLSFSLELLVANLATPEIARGMALQIAYPVLTVLAARWLWRRGMRSYSAVGV